MKVVIAKTLRKILVFSLMYFICLNELVWTLFFLMFFGVHRLHKEDQDH